ncbi:PTS sugar transporter subunit IIA [Clostridium sp. D2Q-14]|uniref:PTS sugar transporter subunit IIA n=1 Tax=Anaeromonas gelatinilytica TaxID=2683194 RepID=UPI00193BE517|nr:PTS sugar transporter subunit IIA [Anaeromonas gelatinilytica]MBS4535085.1 PTS sugar transporter subunit IIA [Anaeromonas gelatinilytica]
MSEIKFNKSLILKLNKEKNNTEVLSTLAEYLCKHGLVKDTYKNAILSREEEYPTGLFTGNINIAIPHTDIQHVNQAAICVGILENPVKFHAMDNPGKKIDVSLIIMLALTEVHGHVNMLQKVIELIQNQKLVKEIIQSNNSKTIYKVIKEQLL